MFVHNSNEHYEIYFTQKLSDFSGLAIFDSREDTSVQKTAHNSLIPGFSVYWTKKYGENPQQGHR